MSVQQKIQEHADRNRALLAILAETDHSVPDLQQQNGFIADLEGRLHETTARLAELDRRRTRDHKEYEKYKDSVMRRFGYKISGRKDKFEEKAAEGEKEYFAGMQETQEREETKRELEGLLSEAKGRKAGLEKEAERHRTAQDELDHMYDSIFQGPSPDFPKEDEAEQRATQALQAYHDHQMRLDGEQQALKLLNQAGLLMHRAIGNMDTARSYSNWDMFGGGAMSSMMKRDELSTAENNYSTARTMVAQAQRTGYDIPDLPPVKVARGSIMTDVVFDNVFTDMSMHEKIKQSEIEMKDCNEWLRQVVVFITGRVEGMQQELKAKERELEETRAALQRTRQAVFERMAQ